MKFMTRSPAASASIIVFALILLMAGGLFYQLNKSEALVLQMLREHVHDVAVAVAFNVDGDLHKEVVAQADKHSPIYGEAIAPLVKLHNQLPSVYYMYTMITKGERAYYVLDTTGEPGLQTTHELETTDMLEEYETDPNDPWIKVIKAGDVYVNEGFEEDKYGTFLSGHAPFYDSNGELSGFSGVDYDVRDYVAWQERFRNSYLFVFFIGSMASAGVGFLVYTFLRNMATRAATMEAASLTDALTGANNRRAFSARTDTDFKRFKRTGLSTSLAIIDVDNFKSINDNYGHEGGDEVLKSIVGSVQAMLRDTDMFARWGGEEFTILFSDTAPKDAELKADRIRQALSKQKILMPSGEMLSMTVSIGISAFDEDDLDPDAAMARADEALYYCKENGRNQVSVILG